MLYLSDSRFHAGVRLFNQREFFACHDEWEEVWGETLGEWREFLQGLIHATVALHHFEEDNLTGARKMYESTRRYLQPFVDRETGIELKLFLIDMRDCFKPLLGNEGRYPHEAELTMDRIPQIAFTSIDPASPITTHPSASQQEATA